MTTPVNPTTSLLLRTLGAVRLDGGSAVLGSRRKELTLLAYLARRAPRSATRGELASLLWEDRGDAKARQSLRQALLDLKRLLGPGLVLDGDAVRVDPGLRLDAQAFEDELARGRPAAAVDWWQGDFLVGMDDVGGEGFRAWVEAEREGLRRQLTLAYEQLLADCERRGDRAGQLAHAERWTELRPLDEVAQRRFIESLVAAGRGSEARARYEAVTARLRAEWEAEPSEAFARLGERLARTSSPPTPGRRIGSAAVFTPDFIGRDEALGELLAAWKEVRDGGRVIVLVEGDPGVGKTRLCEEFLLEPSVAQAGAVCLRAHPGRPGASGSSHLWRQLLAPLASAPGVGGAGAPALAAVASVVRELRERFPGLPEATPNPDELSRAVAEVLSAAGTERPLILLLDDLGTVDPTTQSSMAGVLEHSGPGLLSLVAARSEDADRSPAITRLRSLPGVRRLTLASLDLPQLEAMLGSMLALDAADRHSLALRLHAEGGGNPFYTVEMVSALVDEGSLAAGHSGRWHLAALDERQVPLPRSLREAVGRRLDQLDEGSRQVLDTAAVLGREFRWDLLTSVAGLEASAAESGLEELLTRRLIRRGAPGADSLEFVHELVARVAYERVPVASRARLHQAAARTWRNRRDLPEWAASADYHRARARATAPPRRWPWRAGLAALLAVGAVGLAAGWALGAERRATLATLLTRPAATLVPNRIVVAPLVNRTGDSTLSPIGDMAADWIARGLTQTAQFQVVDPRTAWLTAKLVARMPRLLRPSELGVGIAEETGSGLVVSGGYYRQGDSLRFEVQVTDVASHKLTRSLEPVSGPAGDPASIIPTLARRTVATVATAVDTMSAGMAAGLSQPPSFQAYDEVGRAWESFWRGDTADVFKRTAHASSLDGDYMPPRLMEAYVRSLEGQWPAVDSIVRVVETHRARLTPAENAIVDGLQANLRGDRPGRVRAARDLARLTPGSFEGYTLLADMALSVDDPGQAIDALSHVDPDRGFLLFSPIYWQTMARALHQRGQYAAELEIAQQGLRRFPRDLGPQVALARALAALGRTEDLAREIDRARADAPPPIDLAYLILSAAVELRAHGHGQAADRLLATAPPADSLPPSEIPSLDGERLGADLLYEAGHWAAARQRYAAVFARYRADIESLTGVGVSAARLGDSRTARRVADELGAWTQPFAMGRNTYGRARIAALLGDSAQAVGWLEQSFREGYPVVSIWTRHVHSERDFSGWGAYAPFRVLMRQP